MNTRKTIDYSAMYPKLDELMRQSLPQIELYCEIGRLVCSRAEKGAAIIVSEYQSAAARDCPSRYRWNFYPNRAAPSETDQALQVGSPYLGDLLVGRRPLSG